MVDARLPFGAITATSTETGVIYAIKCVQLLNSAKIVK